MVSGQVTALGYLTAFAWLFASGLLRALRFDSCLLYYVKDPNVFKKTLSCILINGVIFLGSIKLTQWTIKPAVDYLLKSALSPSLAHIGLSAFHSLYNVLWLLPAYTVSFFVNCIYYSEIAEHTALVAQNEAQQRLANASGVVEPYRNTLIQVHKPDALTLVSQEVYRSVLFCVFFTLTLTLRNFPLIGTFLYFLFASWLYALYCFDYKWSLFGVPLELRTQTIEEYWTYFAGFGSSMVAITMLMPFYEGAAIVGVLFPIFIITATDANPREAYRQAATFVPPTLQRSNRILGKLAIFRLPVAITNGLLNASVYIMPQRDLKRAESRRRRAKLSISQTKRKGKNTID